MKVKDYEVREGEGADGAPVYDVYAKYEDDFFADCLDTYFTEEGAYRHVAQLLLDDFEEGSNWYEGIGVDTFSKLLVKNKVPGKDVESLECVVLAEGYTKKEARANAEKYLESGCLNWQSNGIKFNSCRPARAEVAYVKEGDLP